MNEIENDIGRVMAEHDAEAPGAADLLYAFGHAPRPRRRRARWYVPLSAGLAVAAVAVGSIWAGQLLAGRQGGGTKLGGVGGGVRLTCPARYAGSAPWVPVKPAGVDGRHRLVPQRTPNAALICAYAGSNTEERQTGWALSGRRSLTSGLAGLAGQLAWQPGLLPGQDFPCTLIGGPQTNYLIGLTYRTGVRMWVAATDDPNACVRTSNGEFTSFGIVGVTVTRAFATGRWPTSPPASCAGHGPGAGRLGQDKAMVPAGSTSLIICLRHRDIVKSGYHALVSSLNRLATRPSTHGCSHSQGPGALRYRLLFTYSQGPAVLVLIQSGCHPEIDNLSLQADSASTIIPLIQQLLKTK